MDLLLANPRGFCAGVDRAIEIVERALQLHGAPIYVRHEVVHNKFVVDGLRNKGAIFIEDLDDVPSGSILIFSAHGVSRAVRQEAEARGLTVFDATCPLVTKVHIEVSRLRDQNKEIIMIGHKGHPEVEGTMGQSNGGMYLVESPEQVAGLRVQDEQNLAYVTQTTLSVDQQHHRRPQNALPVHHRAKKRRHLLCHAEPPGCGQTAGDSMRCGGRGRFPKQLELQPPARSCGECRRAGLSGG
jgi:4-hydroxy-3-methylbut-2-enyl diphosphate reductase